MPSTEILNGEDSRSTGVVVPVATHRRGRSRPSERAVPYRTLRLEQLEDRLAPGEALAGVLPWSAWISPYLALLSWNATLPASGPATDSAPGTPSGPSLDTGGATVHASGSASLDHVTATTPATPPAVASASAPAGGWMSLPNTPAPEPGPWDFWSPAPAGPPAQPGLSPPTGSTLGTSAPRPPDPSAVGPTNPSAAPLGGATTSPLHMARAAVQAGPAGVVNSLVATTYTLTGPAGGDVDTASGTITVAAVGSLTSNVTVTFSDGNTGGSFSAVTVTLTPAVTVATVTYTPSLYGNHPITTTNNGGLRDPAGINYFANIQTGLGGSLGGLNLAQNGSEWYRDVSQDPVDPNSNSYINLIGATKKMRMAVGQGYGVPYNVVAGNTQPLVPVHFWPKSGTHFYPVSYPQYSDPNTAAGDVAGVYPYHLPIPANAQIEQNSDHHVLILDRDHLVLWELFEANTDDAYQWTTYQNKTIGPNPWKGDGGWTVSEIARWDLTSTTFDTQRPFGWTSADAAGASLLMGVARYDEVVERGVLSHAIRFTTNLTSVDVTFPARHASGSSNLSYPPMGLRVRLKASFNLSGYTGPSLVVMTALKKYGMILADNGAAWQDSANYDPRWGNSSVLGTISNKLYWDLNNLIGSNFEVVQIPTGYTFTGPSSGTVGQSLTFTVSLAANVVNLGAGTQFVTLSDNGAGGTFRGTYGSTTHYLMFTNTGPRTQTFTYIPSKAGTLTLTPTNHSTYSADLVDPKPVVFTVH